jgi:chemosensory pili system protein ChpC
MVESYTDFIPCMLIPLKQHYLLLPNTTIAEVIPMPSTIETIDNGLDFYFGNYLWHQQRIAIIDLENLVENNTVDTSDANKLCVLYSINSDNAINAYALPCHGAPQLIHLNESALKLVDAPEDSDFLHCRIHIANKIAYIPNLDHIEATISQYI